MTTVAATDRAVSERFAMYHPSPIPAFLRKVAISSTLLLTLNACSKAPAKEGSAPTAPENDDPSSLSLKGARIEVATIHASAAGLTLQVPGEVEGARDAQLGSPLGGYIERVPVKEGQDVKKGAELARIDSRLHSTRLVRARVDVKAAQRELKRAESLKGTIPQAEIDALSDRLATAKAALQELEINVQRSLLKAPFAGRVVKIEAEVGEIASPGQALFRLVQLNPAHVSVAISDRDLAVAQVGMPAQIQVDARSGVTDGKVIRLSSAARLRTRSFEAIIEAPNEDESLLPGMIAHVTLSTAENQDPDSKQLYISQDWLVTQPEGVGVFVVEDGKARWRNVELGQVMGRQVKVTSGVKEGDQLVTVGHRSLADGDPVLVQREGTCCTDGRVVYVEQRVR
ncbi:MAG: efflux RND transporter periplasmic adaptor subunit [Polyangiaceae bacterium]|nr:efflux RND transporter periplasmic adaptor subunit [Polyangiaceae bacterium]